MSAAGSRPSLVRAAGAVVWRRGAVGGPELDVEVLVVHRPRYDDWSLPKGKLRAGEPWEDGARREVAEETGVRGALGAELSGASYPVSVGPKLVRYWEMELAPGASPDADVVPNDEVDELTWLAPGEAVVLLSQRSDRVVLSSFASVVGSALEAEGRR